MLGPQGFLLSGFAAESPRAGPANGPKFSEDSLSLPRGFVGVRSEGRNANGQKTNQSTRKELTI